MSKKLYCVIVDSLGNYYAIEFKDLLPSDIITLISDNFQSCKEFIKNLPIGKDIK